MLNSFIYNTEQSFQDRLKTYVVDPRDKAYSIYTDPVISADTIAWYNKFHRRYAVGQIVKYFLGKNNSDWLAAVRDVWAYWHLGIYDLLRCTGDRYVRSSITTWLTLHDPESIKLNLSGKKKPVITPREVVDTITLLHAPADHPYRQNLQEMNDFARETTVM